MVTNYFPRSIGSGRVALEEARGAATDEEQTLLQRALLGVQRVVCSLHGHDPLLQHEDNRLFLRCTTCGHETPGWAIDERRPQLRFAGESRRHGLVNVAGLATSRKVA
jgi:hypothetical protein